MLGIRSRLSRYLSEYLDSRLVLAMDVTLSMVSSFIIFLMLNFFTESLYDTRTFIAAWFGSALVGTLIAASVIRSYMAIIRHLRLRDLIGFALDVAIKAVVMALTLICIGQLHCNSFIAVIGDMSFTLGLVILARLSMMIVYDALRKKAKSLRTRQRVLIYGTAERAMAAWTRLSTSSNYEIVGFISECGSHSDMKLCELNVYHQKDEEHLKKVMDDLSVTSVLFPSEQDAQNEKDGLISFCSSNGIKSLIIPSVEEVVSGKIMKSRIREVKIEDLLGREEIKISMDAIIANFRGKNVMVTGAAGSIGSELCRQLAGFGVKNLILFDNAETPMHELRLELEDRFPTLNFVPVIGDVRQIPRLDFAFRKYRPQIVFHAAAYKHVPLMEENPCEAVRVNAYGSKNVADKCTEYDVEKMVMVSTDKAVNPTNIMGCTKRLAEIYVQSLGLALEQGKKEGRTQFVTTRFGNVLGSNGSVIPRFREQIEKGGPVTVTHPDITRFFMTIPEACRLVMEAATMSTGNQIFVFDMGKSVKIDDLAKKMIKLAGLKLGEDIDIEYTGLRPGEKLYEEVLSNKENTLPTSHDRIRIAKVREYEYDAVLPVYEKLTELALEVNIPDMVILMKKAVPEFISKNSKYEIYDHQPNQ